MPARAHLNAMLDPRAIADLVDVELSRYETAMTFLVTIATAEADLDACLALRRAVFVDEQHVPVELELEGDEHLYTHFLLRDVDGSPLATARLKLLDDAGKAQRVAVARAGRGRGAGVAVMQALHDETRRQGRQRVVLSAQVSAIPFYERLGYAAEGPVYDDAGIPHRDMSLVLPTV